MKNKRVDCEGSWVGRLYRLCRVGRFYRLCRVGRRFRPSRLGHLCVFAYVHASNLHSVSIERLDASSKLNYQGFCCIPSVNYCYTPLSCMLHRTSMYHCHLSWIQGI
jgi:hypothetical protein